MVRTPGKPGAVRAQQVRLGVGVNARVRGVCPFWRWGERTGAPGLAAGLPTKLLPDLSTHSIFQQVFIGANSVPHSKENSQKSLPRQTC